MSSYSHKVWLPTEEELQCEEMPLSGNVLKAGAMQLGKYCETQNDEFMLCRNELGPRYCIKEGKDVTNCALQYFRKLKKLCYHELDRYAYCLDKSDASMLFSYCRKTQAALDKCVYDNMGISRPHYAYFSRPRIYESVRQPPEAEKPQVFANTPIHGPGDPDFPEDLPNKQGSRFEFTELY